MDSSFGFSSTSKFFQNFGSFLDKAFFNVLTSLGTILVTLGGAFIGSYSCSTAWEKVNSFADLLAFLLSNPLLALIFGIPFLIFGSLGVIKDQRQLATENETLKAENSKVTELKRKIDQSEEDCQTLRSDIQKVHQKLVETWLKGISKQIKLDTFSRVTVYYEHNEMFYFLARHSFNPHLSKSHKQKFGLNKGVISHAWKHGECIEDICPTYELGPDLYLDFMSKTYGYSKGELTEFNMKSCRYFALAITEADDNIGVILFESTKVDSLHKDLFTEIRNYCNDYQSHLCNFVRDGQKYDRSSTAQNTVKGNDTDANILNMLSSLGGGNE